MLPDERRKFTSWQPIQSLGWLAEPTRTRTICPGAIQTVPGFYRQRFKTPGDCEKITKAKSSSNNKDPIDPVHPLIHLLGPW